MHYADIAIRTLTGTADALLTYQIEPDQLLKLAPGVIVEVPFRTQITDGVVVALRQTLPRAHLAGRLRPIKRVLSPWPLYTPEDLQLRRELAKQTLQPVNRTLTLGLPSHSLYTRLTRPPTRPLILPKSNQFFLDQQPASLTTIDQSIRQTLKRHATVAIVVPTHEQAAEWENHCRAFCQDVRLYDPREAVANQERIWEIALQGRPAIVLGTRATIFLPFRRLGLILVDSPSHHQLREEQPPYYHAWQVAVLHQQFFGGKLLARDVLPPLELIKLSERRRWQFIRSANQRPTIHIIKRGSAHELATTTLQAIETTYAQGQRTLIVTPQAGWGRGMICQDCERFVRCRACDQLLLVPTATGPLVCPSCQTKITQPTLCPTCQSTKLVTFGWGEQRWADYLRQVFPHRQVFETETMAPGTAQIDVVTPRWSELPLTRYALTVAIEPERLLFRHDFRAREHWLALLLRLCDRTQERLLIETAIPTEPIFAELATRFPKESLRQELAIRKQAGYPPYGHLLEIRLPARTGHSGKTESLVTAQIHQALPASRVFGPYQAGEGSRRTSTWLVKLSAILPISALADLRQHLPKQTRIELDPL